MSAMVIHFKFGGLRPLLQGLKISLSAGVNQTKCGVVCMINPDLELFFDFPITMFSMAINFKYEQQRDPCFRFHVLRSQGLCSETWFVIYLSQTKCELACMRIEQRLQHHRPLPHTCEPLIDKLWLLLKLRLNQNWIDHHELFQKVAIKKLILPRFAFLQQNNFQSISRRHQIQ